VGGWGERPLQTLTLLLNFRNTIAHGRTETLKEDLIRIPAERVDDQLNDFLRPHWEQLIRTGDFAKKARQDVRAILEPLHAAVQGPKEQLFASGLATASVAFQDPPKSKRR
jgi:hypothetical protein